MDKSNLDMNKLADKAWGSMNQILDKEMPQGKDRKRFILWFFLLGTLLLTAFYFIYQTSSKIDQNTFANHSISTSKQNYISDSKFNETISHEDEVEQHSSTVNQIEASENTQSTTKSDLVSNKKEALVFSSSFKEGASIPVLNIDENDLNLLTDSPSSFLIEDYVNIIEESKVKGLASIVQIPALSNLDFSFLGEIRNLRPARYFDLEPVNISEPINEKFRLKHMLSLSSSWTTDGFFKGFGGTFDTQAPLSSRVFALGGVSFHRYKTKDQNSPSFDLSTNESGAFEDVDGPENEMMDENEVTNVENIRNNLEFKDFNAVDFHLGVGMEITKGLGFWVGGNLKYMFSIDQTDFEPILSVGSLGSSLNSNSWFINPKLGMYYDIRDSLRVGVSFEKGFKHVYYDKNNIVEFSPLSFTNLKVAYSF